MDHLISDTTKYGRTPHYARPDGTYYVKIDERVYEQNNADDIRALRAHILDTWRPVDSEGQSLYRRMAAQPDWNVWKQ
jgi:hypothetical protein